MISLRTLINTTFFWFLALIIFWAYTKWIDNTPAKELLYAIGRSDLGNLTVTTNEWLSIDNQSQLIQKLDNMEKMIQATNMNCALLQLNTQSSSTLGINNTTLFPSLPTTSVASQTIAIPVFNSVLNAQLPQNEQATDAALSMIQRPLDSSNPTINDIFSFITNLSLSSDETSKWLINIFNGYHISLGKYTLSEGVLTLPLMSTDSLSSTQFNLISSILEKTYTQFPEITKVIVQQQS